MQAGRKIGGELGSDGLGMNMLRGGLGGCVEPGDSVDGEKRRSQ